MYFVSVMRVRKPIERLLGTPGIVPSRESVPNPHSVADYLRGDGGLGLDRTLESPEFV